jgi:hypothetical protein
MTAEQKTDEQVIATSDDLQMMLRPHLWPLGFRLPLIRRARVDPATGARREPGVGVLCIWDEGVWLWYEGALVYTLPSVADASAAGKRPRPVRLDRDGVVALADAGWEVD